VTKSLAVLALLVALAAVPVPPAAAAGCGTPKGGYPSATPWAQKLVDAPRIWPLSTGTGVTVAVVGTGVDAANAQFAPGQVLPPPMSRAPWRCCGPTGPASLPTRW
jgi:hypothetical protein